jgi:hypothetical protein
VFYEEVFRKLSDREVKYAVAGGVALVLYGVVALKRNANRPQDIADIDALEEIEQMEHEDE